jgi:imidazolonepropionase-like amidohydrolase
MYEPVPKALLDRVEAARTTLHAGYTAVREIAARDYPDVFLRDAQRKGQIDGPRMLAAIDLGVRIARGSDCCGNESHRHGQNALELECYVRSLVRTDVVGVVQGGRVMRDDLGLLDEARADSRAARVTMAV